MNEQKIFIHWFRKDLRLSDNPALHALSKLGTILPIYILDDDTQNPYKMGAASRYWLHHSLLSLNASLEGKLSLYRGNPIKIITDLIQRYKIEMVSWNRCYEPHLIKHDTQIVNYLKSHNISFSSHNASLLWEPLDIKKGDGTYYKVFTAFYKNGCLKAAPPRRPLNKPCNISLYRDVHSLSIDQLELLEASQWHKKFEGHWKIGESAAHQQLHNFILTRLHNYKEGRNFPAQTCTSLLSPHLSFGEISPQQIWHAICESGDDPNIQSLCTELGWREFSYHQLYHNPQIPTHNIQKRFDDFPWKNNPKLLHAWQKGKTGIPMVDAGMRQLWETGYIHNRARMIVGSFLVKNLLIHWKHGADWFWDCLVDADLANNSAGWQWVAGCGLEAAPYFRIFNPISQGQKFDPQGEYVRKFVPELKKLDNKYIFAPWDAPKEILQLAGISLGKDYPEPIVDLKSSRAAALKAFLEIRNSQSP